jgi:hypothetical protein
VEQRWVDVSHEALIRGWPRLREWIDQDRGGRLLHDRLAEAAKEWERSARDDSLLYRGLRLGQAREWRERNDELLNDLERAFLDASAALREREAAEREARQPRELERERRLRSSRRRRGERHDGRPGCYWRLLWSGLPWPAPV